MPPATISISTSREHQSEAAHHLSESLGTLNCRHAYIGGFAWSLLGSSRPTEDIDVLIETENVDILALREKLKELDNRFASAGLKFYFIQNADPGTHEDSDALVRKSKDNVLIETLRAGSLGLPEVAEPTYKVKHESGKFIFQILHPSVLILTKLKRWAQNYTSTRPKTLTKSRSDKNDIDFLIYWLAENNMKVQFDLYRGKSKPELLDFVRKYCLKFSDNEELLQSVEKIMESEDWDLLQLCNSS